MVQPGRFERPTSSFAGKRSIQLSYGCLERTTKSVGRVAIVSAERPYFFLKGIWLPERFKGAKAGQAYQTCTPLASPGFRGQTGKDVHEERSDPALPGRF